MVSQKFLCFVKKDGKQLGKLTMSEKLRLYSTAASQVNLSLSEHHANQMYSALANEMLPHNKGNGS